MLFSWIVESLNAFKTAIDRRMGQLEVDDQLAGARYLAALPYVDKARLGVTGWSYGGYMTLLLLTAPDSPFKAGVAGAPVTDWALYDTHYTERFLGTPDDQPEVYRACSLLEDAAELERPLMIVHGLADDNVVFAHTLRLSSALLAAGRPHTVLPLSGVTHLASEEAVAENLLLLQVEFLRSALARPSA